MSRPITYDVTHLVSRLAAQTITGIDRIDLAYGQHFATRDGEVLAAFCRAARPYVLAPTRLQQIVRRARICSWEHASLEADGNFIRIKNWLDGREPGKKAVRKLASPQRRPDDWLAAKRWKIFCQMVQSVRTVPRGSIYLNVAEHWLEYHHYFDWLRTRPDVQAVFFVHDLLPLDYPEYFRPDYDAIFLRRFETLAKCGTAFITSTNVVRDRLARALTDAGRPVGPIYVAPLPSPLAATDNEDAEHGRTAHPYFILVSTIEPRKNHLLVLNIWRELVAALGEATPRLVLIGSRGWEDEQIIDMLDRCEGITKYVLRSARISQQGLTWLMRRAQALLMPSFDEGYGLPVVEALSLGTPVIASDNKTFREVATGSALLLSPIDGVAWREAIMALSRSASPEWKHAKARTSLFQSPDWASYFRGLDAFLCALP